MLSVPTCSKIPITILHLLLFLTYSQFATPLCFPQCCPSHLLFKYLFSVLFSLQNETPGLACEADNVQQLHSLAFCWLLLTRSCDLEKSNASSICNSSRQSSSDVLFSSGLLRNVCRELCIDVSGRYISPIFKVPLGLLTQLPARSA
jgi:hypothetical protein